MELGERIRSLRIQKGLTQEELASRLGLVRVTGLEPAREAHQNLNLARLPIPPYPRKDG